MKKMSNRLIKIIIGAALVLIIGFLVFATKKPAFVSEKTNLTEISANQEKQTVAKKIVFAKNKFLDDDDGYSDDDDDDDKKNNSIETSPTASPSASTQSSSQASSGSITLSQMAQHDSRASCWSAINGGVYDLTSWIPNHPGGEQAILSICGLDGSAGYNSQHGGSSKITKILFGFKIGTLIN